MRYFRLERAKLWSSAVAVAGVQQQKYRRKVVETSHCQPQVSRDCAKQNQPVQDPENDIERKADMICNKYLREYSYSVGFAVAVSVDGEMKYRKAFGMKDPENHKRANVEDFTTQIWSVTKPITAHCWAKCLDNVGNIDAFTLNEILTEFPTEVYIEKNNEELGIDQYRKKTIHHDISPSNLLTHTAGIVNNETGFFSDIEEIDFTQYRSAAQFLRKYRAVCKLFTGSPMRKWDYSNFGYDLIPAMLERMQGKNYRDYSLEQLISFGMADTDYHYTDEVYMSETFGGYCVANTETDQTSLAWGECTNLSIRYGSASLVSNVDDLDKFGNLTARMYKRAYIDGSGGTMNDSPLKTQTIISQHGALCPLFIHNGEWEEQNAGWTVHRGLESNVKRKRRVKVRFKHDGLGMGFTALLSVGFHRVKVPEKPERANPTEEEKSAFAARARQLNPTYFTLTTVPLFRGQARQVLDSEWKTRWDLPADVQVLWTDWDEYAPQFVRVALSELNERAHSYLYSARMYLYLMARAQTPQFRANMDVRLGSLIDTFERLDETKQLLRHLMRKQIREHRRVCRNEEGSLSREDMEKFEEICDSFEQEQSAQIISAYDRIRSKFASRQFTGARDEIRNAQGLVPLTDPSFRYTATNRLYELRQHVGTFDLRTPFNLSQRLWNTWSSQLQQGDHENKRSFDEVELDAEESCLCDKYARLTRLYGSHQQQRYYRHYYNSRNVLQPDTDEQEQHEPPLSWRQPVDVPPDSGDRDSDDGPRRKLRRFAKRKEEKARLVVVSIVTNSRNFEVQPLGPELDELFAQHYDS